MFQCILFFCFFLAPPAPPPGGFVPFTNARVLPDGTLRPYDPVLDGIMGPDGRVFFPALMPPERSGGAPYPPPGRVEVGPPMVMPAPPTRAPRNAAKPGKPMAGGCYDGAGRPVEPMPPGCQTQSAPLLSSGPAPDPEWSL